MAERVPVDDWNLFWSKIKPVAQRVGHLREKINSVTVNGSMIAAVLLIITFTLLVSMDIVYFRLLVIYLLFAFISVVLDMYGRFVNESERLDALKLYAWRRRTLFASAAIPWNVNCWTNLGAVE